MSVRQVRTPHRPLEPQSSMAAPFQRLVLQPPCGRLARGLGLAPDLPTRKTQHLCPGLRHLLRVEGGGIPVPVYHRAVYRVGHYSLGVAVAPFVRVNRERDHQIPAVDAGLTGG